ncbi:MAG: RluA family pseudouridine synthase [Candidatus Margulisbacteria bacterium]|jgi:RluA family pseudouridine synthase|nr:RluA family pseudouridine synthase [Candidatus Margulisiibacteriota bacterium]
MRSFKAAQAAALKDFLSGQLSISGAGAKKLLDQKKVFVNKQRVWIAGYRLNAGDTVEVQDSPTAARYAIAAEDSDYLIINKPAGIIVNEHPHSLENMLRADLKNPRLVAAHRLDKDTSGLVIFAKNYAAFTKLVEVFKNLGVEKYYRGLVQGDLSSRLAKHFTLTQNINGQSAAARFTIIKSNKLASYFEANLITGRKHQIRLQLSRAGFPLLGENTYQTGALEQAVYRQIPRQMLHSCRLKFTNPCTGQILQAAARDPADLQNALKKLGL